MFRMLIHVEVAFQDSLLEVVWSLWALWYLLDGRRSRDHACGTFVAARACNGGRSWRGGDAER